MDIIKFSIKRPYLYHLTDVRNLPIIRQLGVLLSTKNIIEQSTLGEFDRNAILRSRRPNHREIEVDGRMRYIRDQRPISEVNLVKCLTPGLSIGDFLEILNSRVFFWPTINRLNSHFIRYAHEKPCIIKIPTDSLIQLNPHVECCRLNSGATRSNSHLGGAPPERGQGTFLSPSNYLRSVGSVAEVTFPENCFLPEEYFIGYHPNGPWQDVWRTNL